MKRFIYAGVLTSLVLFPMFGYVYCRGASDGIDYYRKSKAFERTLFSMYRYGVQDGCTNSQLCAALLPKGKKK